VVVSRIFVHGIGAVSPAGWGVDALRLALEKKAPLPSAPVMRPGWEKPLVARVVPPPQTRPAFFAHPRLRRSTMLAQYVVAASLEALGDDATRVQNRELRFGAVVATQVGCVNYSRRFYEEVLKDPPTASPVLFPETVFNAPASHLAAYLNSNGLNYSLVGDDGTFVQALALAAQWLMQDKADVCVAVGAEELDWVVADAVRLFERNEIYSGGAGAICLKREPGGIAELSAITDSFLYTQTQSRKSAAEKMHAQLSPLVTNGFSDLPRILGKAFNAAAAWQCVVACDSLRRGKLPEASIGIVGANQQAIGVKFRAVSGSD
jgi:3-oxoacyl-(acyl-carrier-protein) synthase